MVFRFQYFFSLEHTVLSDSKQKRNWMTFRPAWFLWHLFYLFDGNTVAKLLMAYLSIFPVERHIFELFRSLTSFLWIRIQENFQLSLFHPVRGNSVIWKVSSSHSNESFENFQYIKKFASILSHPTFYECLSIRTR